MWKEINKREVTMKRIFLRLKQRFCKHRMQKVSTVRIETRPESCNYITKVNTREVFECTKCKKRMELEFPYSSGTWIHSNQ